MRRNWSVMGVENRNVMFNNSFEKLGCKSEEQGTIA